MIAIRSLLFNIYLYAWTIIICVIGLFLVPFPRRIFFTVLRAWAKWVAIGLRVICGIDMEVRGREYIPKGGALLASKHQSMWDTIIFFCLVDDLAIVLKKEISYIPLFGWLTIKCDMLHVDRTAGAKALKTLVAKAKKAIADQRQIVIFPEGSRAPAGAALSYKPGIAALYNQLGVPCVPIALNSGVFWPRHKFLRPPGCIIIEFLEPIAHGLKRKAFMSELETRIETASTKLYEEGLRRLEGAKNSS
jgi:1-acyl-sn-glycerol-3-phosphate acyltransferase